MPGTVVVNPLIIDDISSGTQTNDVKVTLDNEQVVIGAGSNNIGDVDVLTMPVRSHLTDSFRIGDGATLVDAINYGGGNRLRVETYPASGASAVGQNVIITDPNSSDRQAFVDASGRLLVSTQPPTPPVTSIPVIETAFSSLGNNAVVNTFYTITSGDTLTLQRFEAAAEAASDGWFMYLFDDPDADGGVTSAIQTSWVLISLIVINELGDSKFVDLTPTELVGDGTRRVVMRRERKNGGGAKEGFIKISGFEE